MHRKRVRQKAHAPGKRTPRYPASTKPTGRQRRLGSRGFAASRAATIKAAEQRRAAELAAAKAATGVTKPSRPKETTDSASYYWRGPSRGESLLWQLGY